MDLLFMSDGAAIFYLAAFVIGAFIFFFVIYLIWFGVVSGLNEEQKKALVINDLYSRLNRIEENTKK